MNSDMSQGAISVNGIVSAPGEARVSAMDHGFLYGDSVYEVVRTYERRPVAMGPHLERMRASAAQLYFELPWTDAELVATARATVEATELPECYVRIVATRGPGPMSLLPDGCDHPTLLVYVLPLRTPSAEQLAAGITIVIPKRLHRDPAALAASAKTGNYLTNLLALVEAQSAGAADAVQVNAVGNVTEATTANVFWVRDGAVFTPSLASGILPGITRKLLLPAIRADGLALEDGSYPLDDLLGADECFLTGTVRGVCPVVRIGAAAVGDGRPGPVTKRIMELHERLLVETASDW